MSCSQEVLGFVAAPLVINHNTLTEHTTNENSNVAQIDRAWIHIMRKKDSIEEIQIWGHGMIVTEIIRQRLQGIRLLL